MSGPAFVGNTARPYQEVLDSLNKQVRDAEHDRDVFIELYIETMGELVDTQEDLEDASRELSALRSNVAEAVFLTRTAGSLEEVVELALKEESRSLKSRWLAWWRGASL